MLSSLTNVVDRRFLFNSLLPSLLFAASLAFVWAGAGPIIAVTRWQTGDLLFLAVVVIAGAALLACLLSGTAGEILRLYEGYWPGPPGRFVASAGRRWHRRRLARLAQEARLIHMTYPLPSQADEVMPTRFGNILRSAELYPRDRYGIETAITWPRLYSVLPDRLVTLIAAARGAVDLLLTISFLAAIFAITSGAYILAIGGPWWRFLACFWGGLAVAWLTYLGALPSAVVYGQHIRTAFDLYRHDLLDQLHVASLDERDQWRRLAHYWLRNIPLDVVLEPDESPQRDTSARGLGPTVPLSMWVAIVVIVMGVAGSLVLR